VTPKKQKFIVKITTPVPQKPQIAIQQPKVIINASVLKPSWMPLEGIESERKTAA